VISVMDALASNWSQIWFTRPDESAPAGCMTTMELGPLSTIQLPGVYVARQAP
jgi:hypothetical protein